MKVLRGHWQLMVLTGAVLLLWSTPVVIPLKILIVFFHEPSHAIATWATGGSVESISLSPQQGGVTVTGAVVMLGAALFVREWFALAFTAGTGVVMLASARYLSRDVNDMALRVIGLCLRYGLGRHSNISNPRETPAT